MKKIEPKIIILASKNLVGMKTNMSLVHNKTGILWQNFMPKRKQIKHVISNDLYSMQLYDTDYFVHFTPQNTFTKWACVEVSHFENLPLDCESFNLHQGLYAVFHYKGLSSDTKIFEYILFSFFVESQSCCLQSSRSIKIYMLPSLILEIIFCNAIIVWH